MIRANTVSPFAAEQADLPWTTWKRTAPVMALQEKPTESRSAEDDDASARACAPELQIPSVPIPYPAIQRNRYDAVMTRMKNASRGATHFSAWST